MLNMIYRETKTIIWVRETRKVTVVIGKNQHESGPGQNTSGVHDKILGHRVSPSGNTTEGGDLEGDPRVDGETNY